MNTRYTNLFYLDKNLYLEGAPVIIKAGALLKDNNTGNILAQLKFQNVSNKKIKYLKVTLKLIDSLDRDLSEEVVKEYLDLDIELGEDFGSKSPIFINNPSARKYSAHVTEVGFVHHDCWSAAVVEWDKLPELTLLPEELNEYALRAYKERFGNEATYAPLQYKDIWVCSCGTANPNASSSCVHCHSDLNEMLDIDKATFNNDSAYNKALSLISQNTLTSLKEAKEILSELSDWRETQVLLANCESTIAELEATQAKEEAEEARKMKIIRRVCAIIGGAVVLFLIFIAIIFPASMESSAKKKIKEGNYKEALEIYERLDRHWAEGLNIFASENGYYYEKQCDTYAEALDKYISSGNVNAIKEIEDASLTFYLHEYEPTLVTNSLNQRANYNYALSLIKSDERYLTEPYYYRLVSYILRALPKNYESASAIYDYLGAKNTRRDFLKNASSTTLEKLWKIPVIKEAMLEDYLIDMFLLGEWYYQDELCLKFYMESNDSYGPRFRYYSPLHVPNVSCDYYDIENKVVIYTKKKGSDSSDTYKVCDVFKLTFYDKSPHIIDVYSYEDNKTFTLYRK